jgi:flagellin-like hook-associated protein FlgL
MMVKNMEYWAAKQLENLNDASTVVASGKQINKPSNDPTAAKQIMEDRVTISAYGQYESNIDNAETWVETSNTTLDTVYSLLQEAEELFTSQSSADDASSVDYSDELEQIYNQVISYANSMYGSNYMYSGNQGNILSFSNSVEVSGGVSTNILFDLAAAASDLTIEITDSSGAVVRTLTVTGGVEGTNTITWDGCNDDGNPLADGDYDFTVSAEDEEGNAVAVFPSYRGDEGGKEVITGVGSVMTLNNNGGEIFSRALKVLSQALTALKDADSDTDLSSDLGSALKEAASRIKTEEVKLANMSTQLDNAYNHLDQLTEYLSERVSDLETGSSEQAVIELESQQTAYETTLAAAADVLKMPTLKDYLS